MGTTANKHPAVVIVGDSTNVGACAAVVGWVRALQPAVRYGAVGRSVPPTRSPNNAHFNDIGLVKMMHDMVYDMVQFL